MTWDLQTVLWVFGALHLTLCLILFLLIKTDVLVITSQLFWLVLLVPVWGMLIWIPAEIMSRRATSGNKHYMIHTFTIESCADEYRSLGILQDDRLKSVVPLEEAIAVNDAKTRRQFMLDVLSQDYQEYVDLLKKARFSDDIEVAHYASTAIMEIQRSYELRIQKYRGLCRDYPDNATYLDNLIHALRSYIESGLIEESVLQIQRERYHQALEQRIRLSGAEADPQLYYTLIDNLLELGDTKGAEHWLNLAFAKWPSSETPWLLSIKLRYYQNDGPGIRETIQRLKKARLFLSTQAKEEIAFWSRQMA